MFFFFFFIQCNNFHGHGHNYTFEAIVKESLYHWTSFLLSAYKLLGHFSAKTNKFFERNAYGVDEYNIFDAILRSNFGKIELFNMHSVSMRSMQWFWDFYADAFWNNKLTNHFTRILIFSETNGWITFMLILRK